MEDYLKGIQGKIVYNTTKNGAKIENTIYRSLDDLMIELKERVVPNNWFYHQRPNDNIDFVRNKWEQLIREKPLIEKNINDILTIVNDIEETLNRRKLNKLQRKFIKLDGRAKELSKIIYYKIFLATMSRFEYEIVSKEISAVRAGSDLIYNTKVIVNQYKRLIKQWEISAEIINNE